MTHDLETTLNASVSSSPGNKKIWTTPVVQPLWGADASGAKTYLPFESSPFSGSYPMARRHVERWGGGGASMRAVVRVPGAGANGLVLDKTGPHAERTICAGSAGVYAGPPR